MGDVATLVNGTWSTVSGVDVSRQFFIIQGHETGEFYVEGGWVHGGMLPWTWSTASGVGVSGQFFIIQRHETGVSLRTFISEVVECMCYTIVTGSA